MPSQSHAAPTVREQKLVLPNFTLLSAFAASAVVLFGIVYSIASTVVARPPTRCFPDCVAVASPVRPTAQTVTKAASVDVLSGNAHATLVSNSSSR